jgi:alpha-ribazole phosphatase
MRVVLVRHPAPAIGQGVCYGRLDVGVDPAAGEQVGRIASDPGLRGARLVWTSPAVRCRGVAEAIAVAMGVPLRVDGRLWELDFGEWEGRPWAAIARADLDRWAESPSCFAPPGGESGAALIARVRDFHAGICDDCVVVSHGGPLNVLGALLRDQPIDLLAPPPPIGSVTIVSCCR